ncbi:hypothetical protein EOD42_02950 [Rhodovarius crocodyli]|uniref:Uncharacterized protein n=1 Tax=Rhodovarius crocodyli TaxID=1979269 RepID=A0A437MN57_9PROT|nr:hypothetical protein [Rhodovarius crocodyli]RVT99081.1 hypothetical protein EOD42_02950 [Rhodovarius crocodyli]
MKAALRAVAAKLRDSIRFHRCGWGWGVDLWWPSLCLGRVELRWSRPGAREEMRRLRGVEDAHAALRERVQGLSRDVERKQ